MRVIFDNYADESRITTFTDGTDYYVGLGFRSATKPEEFALLDCPESYEEAQDLHFTAVEWFIGFDHTACDDGETIESFTINSYGAYRDSAESRAAENIAAAATLASLSKFGMF